MKYNIVLSAEQITLIVQALNCTNINTLPSTQEREEHLILQEMFESTLDEVFEEHIISDFTL